MTVSKASSKSKYEDFYYSLDSFSMRLIVKIMISKYSRMFHMIK